LTLGANSKNREDFVMKSKGLWRAIQMVTVVLLAVAPRMLAQDPPPVVHLSGLINDYTPVSGVSGPWEIRGEWSLELKGDSGKATFSANVNMTHSDYWVVLNPGAADDDSAMTGRHPHTHLITVSKATITALAGGGFELSGQVFVTADGDAAPFMSKCSDTTQCKLTIDVVGGNVLPLSNITLTFSGPPTTHFGTQAIHGFIRMGN
jgi:hypothetical protein